MSERVYQIKFGPDDDQRALLEKSAAKYGHTLSEEIRRRLWMGMAAGEPLDYVVRQARTFVVYNSAYEK